MTHVRTQTHEVSGHLLFDASDQPFAGDRPYWALRSIFSNELGGGASGVPVAIDGEEWSVSLSYQESGLEPRREDDADQLYEYRLNADGAGYRKLRLLVQPRLDWGAEQRPGSVPADLGLATNVRVDIAVNVDARDLPALIPQLFSETFQTLAVGWTDDFFSETPHEYSTITQLEQYVRLERDQARKLVRLDGVFHRLFNLVADREGSKIVYSADNRDVVGHNHQVRLDTAAMSELFEGWRTGGQFKHYHPEHVGERDPDDPLYHPKVGFLFKQGWNDGHAVAWSRAEELVQQCEENLLNLLEWADVSTKPGGWFVADDHFAPVASDRDVAFFDDPTPAIDQQQDSVVLRTMQRLTDSDRDVLEAVALTDGGENPHVDEVAAESGWAESTIYRVLDRLGGLLESDDGNVQFVSAKIAERVQDVIDVASDAVDAAARAVEDVLSVDPRDLERKGRAWQNWLNRYGAELVDDGRDGERATIRIRQVLAEAKSLAKYSGVPFAGEIVNYGYIAWRKAGRDGRTFREATIVYDSCDGGTETIRAKDLLTEVRDDVLRLPG